MTESEQEELFLELYSQKKRIEKWVTSFLMTPDKRFMGFIDEVVGDSYYKALKNLKDFKEQAEPMTWLHTIARNQARDCIRRNKGLERICSWDQIIEEGRPVRYLKKHPEWDPFACLNSRELRESALAVLKSLSPKYIMILYLRHQEGMKLKDIGDELGLSHSRVRNCIFRVRQQFRTVGLIP